MKDIPQKAISAGGIVRKIKNGKVYIALIHRPKRIKWFLPKGHVDKNESIKEAAIREIREETGLKNIKYIKKLGFKERFSFGRYEFKRIYYFLFDCEDKCALRKVLDNDQILKPKWFLINNLPPLFWKEQRELIAENLEMIKNIA